MKKEQKAAFRLAIIYFFKYSFVTLIEMYKFIRKLEFFNFCF